MNRAEMLRQIMERGIRPLHGRSQNFLLDESVVAKMVTAAGLHAGETVVEIGAGPGILTAALLDAGARVTAVEIDQRLCRLQRELFGDRDGYRLVEADVMTLSTRELTPDDTTDGGYRLIANLPYAITTPLITKFLTEAPRPASLTVMVQREVADRIMAKPGQMSSLAVFIQSLARVSLVTRVPRGAFLPPPKVDSSVIHIERLSTEELDQTFQKFSPEDFFGLVRAGFLNPRKQLKNTLRSLVRQDEDLNSWLKSAEIPPTSRPEQLSVQDWFRLMTTRPR